MIPPQSVQNSAYRALSNGSQSDDESQGDESEDEDDSGGWFDNAVDTVIDKGGDVVGGTKDKTGTVWDSTQKIPGAVWNVTQEAPGAVWDVIEQVPHAVGGAAYDSWNWLRNASSTSITWDGWAAFLTDHPLLGVMLAPVMLILFGLSPDGSISVLDISLAGLLLIVPAAKGFQALRELAAPFLSRLARGEDVFSAVTRIPVLLRLDPADLFMFLRARTISPTLDIIAKLPSSPGVYVVLDASETPIYVGKASLIKRRLIQHFTPPKSVFADEATTIKIIPTKSSTDALRLECRLIKSFSPKYNDIFNNDRPCPIFIEPLAPVYP